MHKQIRMYVQKHMRIRNGCRTQTAMRPQTPKHTQSWTFIKNLWLKLNRVKSSYYINKALNRNVTLAVDWTLPLTTSRGHSVIPENSLFNWQPVKHFLFSVQMAAKFSSTLRSLAVLYDHRVLLYFTSRELYSCCMYLFILNSVSTLMTSCFPTLNVSDDIILV